MIAIPNMEKPKSCTECFYGLRCKAVPRWITTDESIPKDCPLIDIVRCGECKRYEPYDSTRPYDCPRGMRQVNADDFCSYGEPRESEYVAKD